MLTPSVEQIEAYLWGERFDDRLNLLIEDRIREDDKWSEARAQIQSIQATAKAELGQLESSDIQIRNKFVINSLIQKPIPEAFRDRVIEFVEDWLEFEFPTPSVYEAIGRRLLIDLQPFKSMSVQMDVDMSMSSIVEPVRARSMSVSLASAPSFEAFDPNAELKRFLREVFPQRYDSEEKVESAMCVVRRLRGQDLMAALLLISEFDSSNAALTE